MPEACNILQRLVDASVMYKSLGLRELIRNKFPFLHYTCLPSLSFAERT